MARFEKSPFEPGAYIAYDARGFAFRVRREHVGRGWVAFPAHSARASDKRRFYGETLSKCAAKIEADGSFSTLERLTP